MSRLPPRVLLFLIALGALGLFVPAVLAGEKAAPLAPAESQRTLRPRPGFTVELVAAEPLIESPVAFDWGPDGKLWVVEMRDYPLGMDNKGKPGGRVVYLEDTDGDGRYDKSTVFLDGLLFPTGVMAWGKGVLVTCAPDILYAEDTDGDGKADVVRKLFTGFGEANPQHRVNGLRWGLDNWVYCANGDFAAVRTFGPAVAPDKSTSGFSPSQAEDLRRLALAGARVRSAKTEATYDIRNRDFRIRPDGGLLDPQSGQAQFGRDRDDWGNWFGCNNAVPMWHYALDDHYLRRNPHVAAPSPRVEGPRSLTYTVGSVGRGTGTPRSAGGNAFTSGCGITIYRDDLFGPDFANNWFVCEPVHNLVHREVLVPTGTTFSSKRAADEATSEFLASSDPMFTPVLVRTGPDGALWVADMYRLVLEHPHWLPAGWEKTTDVRVGHDKGRIYKVYPTGKKLRPVQRFDRMKTAELVALLESPNGVLRDKAQQLLVERHDPAAVKLLVARAADSTPPLGRLQALCTLDGLHALEAPLVKKALTDMHPGVRRHAARLAESFVNRSPELAAALVKTAEDTEPTVRLQAAYSLGSCDTPEAARALGRLLTRDARDPYITAAALSSLNRKNLATVAESVLRSKDVSPQVTTSLLQSAVGFDEPRAVVLVLNHLTRSEGDRPGAVSFAALAGWLDALDQRNTPLERVNQQAGDELRAALKKLAVVFESARKAARDPRAAMEVRLQAVRLLGRGLDHQAEDRAALAELLAPQTPDQLQAAAVTALGRLRGTEPAGVLLKHWKALTPSLRSQALDALLSRADGGRLLLDALERKALLPQDVTLTARQRLLDHPNKEVHDRAGRTFRDAVNPDRARVVAAYEPALKIAGDAGRGLRTFAKNCAVCHRLGVVGTAVGPDLASVRDKPPEWFLPAILDPSRAVEARYLNYQAVTKEGKVFTGVLAEEGGNSLTLVGPNGERQVVLRTNLDELYSTGKSAMPDGLEKALQPQDVADVIAFLRGQGPPRKTVPLNRPDLVKPGAGGALNLTAEKCEIFGDEIKVYDKHRCLGWWTGADDRAVWTFELEKPGRYAVWIDWSCDDGSAGQGFVVEAGGRRLTGKVASTGDWDKYRQEQVGEITLDSGVSQLTFRAAGKVRPASYLIDLKAVSLKPLPAGKAAPK